MKPRPAKRIAALLLAALVLCSCAAALPPERQRLLAFGASLAEKNGMGYEAVFDRDATFARMCKETLATAWGVTDESSAKQALTWLLDHGIREFSRERYNADEILALAQNPETASSDEELALVRSAVMSYDECAATLKRDYGYTDETLRGIVTLAAFDYDRLVTLGRWCVKAGYVTEEDYFDYAGAAALSAENYYSDWEQYYAAVMLGRAISVGWSASETEIAERLLKSEESPYKKYEFGGQQ
jgi:hypothetical protein